MTSSSRYPAGLDPATQWYQRKGPRRGSFWPDTDEELLLRAVLGDDADAVAAIDEWQQTVDIDQISYGSYRLVPMLYRNAARLGVPLEHAGIVSGIYRRSWYGNTILLDRAVPAVAALADAGIESMLLKGAALMVNYYADGGVRPLGDIDILVRRADADRALEVLAGSGWMNPHAVRLPALSAASALTHPAEGAIDLHQTYGWEVLSPAAESAIWEAGRSADLGGVRVLVQAPEDLLLHTLVHGIAPGGGIRWVADASTIITKAHDLDWDRFEALMSERHIAHRVSEGLGYVADTFDVPIPDGVRARLQGRSHSGWERRELIAYKRWRPGSRVWGLVRVWYWYRRRCAVEDRRAHPWGFLRMVTEASDRSRSDVVRGVWRSTGRNRVARRG